MKASDPTILTPQFHYSKILKYFERKRTDIYVDEANMKFWI